MLSDLFSSILVSNPVHCRAKDTLLSAWRDRPTDSQNGDMQQGSLSRREIKGVCASHVMEGFKTYFHGSKENVQIIKFLRYVHVRTVYQRISLMIEKKIDELKKPINYLFSKTKFKDQSFKALAKCCYQICFIS